MVAHHQARHPATTGGTGWPIAAARSRTLVAQSSWSWRTSIVPNQAVDSTRRAAVARSRGRERSVECSSEVVPFGDKDCSAAIPVFAGEPATCILGDADVVRHVGMTNDILIRTLGKLLFSELPERFEHAVAAIVLRAIELDHRFVDELAEHDCGVCVRVDDTADAFGRHEIETAGEHRQRREEPLFRVVEETIRPLDHRPERLMPFRGTPATTEQPETIIEVIGQVAHTHRARPRRSQLDRQRVAVEPLTDRDDRGTITVGRVE